jgi:hypothetical protein
MGDEDEHASSSSSTERKRPPIPTELEIVKHPVPKRVYILFGVRFIFSYSILHLSLFSFTYTYLNILTLFEYKVYSSLMTGNFFNSALDFESKLYMDVLFRLTLIVSCTTLGTFVDCYLLLHMKNRRNAFAVLMLMLVASVILADIIHDSTDDGGGRYSLAVLCVTSGALVHWSQKLGYICSAMTGNMFKIAELMFNFFNGYDVGGPKMHGEALIYVSIFASALVGALSAIYMFRHGEVVALYGLIATVPFHLYLAGCLEEWGLITGDADPKPKPDAASLTVELGRIHSPMVEVETPSARSVRSDSESFGLTRNSDSDRRNSIFEVMPISDAEIQDTLDVESGYAYRRDKAMFYDA